MENLNLNLGKIIGKYWILLILILTIPAFWALLVPGYYGASDDLHIGWLHQLDKTIKLGQFPPRFVPDLSFGFGYPLFNFVFPLPFYLAEILHIFGLSLVDSIKGLFLLTVPMSAMFMYLLLREFIKPPLSLFGAILYVYTPYRALDLYIRGAIGEILSFVFLPLIILSIIKISKNNFRWVGIGALSIGALILTHNITAYMFIPFGILLGLLLLFKNLKAIKNLIITIGLGALVSIYFWLPALLDNAFMKYDTVFNFVDHFPTIKQLIFPYWGYGASVPGPYDGISFNIGVLNFLIIIASLAVFFKFRNKFSSLEKSIFFWLVFTFGIAFFLMNYRSSFIWANAPLFGYFQFPWRFLILTTVLSPLFLIFLNKIEIKAIWIILVLPVLIGISFHQFRPQDFLGRTDEYYLNRYIPVPSASDEYKLTQEEYLRLPQYTNERPDRNYPPIFGGEFTKLSIQNYNGLNLNAKISSEKETTLSYSKYFYPGWIAEIDGQKANIFAGDPFGQIGLKIPPGTHNVKINFTETPFKFFLDLISAFSILLTLIMIWKHKQFTKN